MKKNIHWRTHRSQNFAQPLGAVLFLRVGSDNFLSGHDGCSCACFARRKRRDAGSPRSFTDRSIGKIRLLGKGKGNNQTCRLCILTTTGPNKHCQGLIECVLCDPTHSLSPPMALAREGVSSLHALVPHHAIVSLQMLSEPHCTHPPSHSAWCLREEELPVAYNARRRGIRSCHLHLAYRKGSFFMTRRVY